MPKTMDVRAAHYEEYVEGKDRPVWDKEVLKERYERWKEATNDYVQLEQRVAEVLRSRKIPNISRPPYYSLARTLLRRKRNGEIDEVLLGIARYYVEEIGLNADAVNDILKIVGVGGTVGRRATR